MVAFVVLTAAWSVSRSVASQQWRSALRAFGTAVAVTAVVGWQGWVVVGAVGSVLLLGAAMRIAPVRLGVANVVVLAALLGLMEVGVRFAGALSADRSLPLPYRGAPYYDDAFAAERERFIAFTGSEALWSERNDGRGPYRANGVFDGDLITILDGVRTTTRQPATVSSTIWLLGGSTMLCGEVPDDWTIASLLQLQLGATDAQWRVVNLGVNAASVGGNLAQLRGQTQLRRGDIVVVYGGVNNIRGVVDEGARWQGAHELLTSRVVDPWRARSRLLQRLDDVVNAPMLSYSDEDMSAGAVELMEDLRAARIIADAAGARLLFVLQPNLFEKPSRSSYEIDLAGRWQTVFRDAVAANYREFRTLVDAHTSWMVDLSGVLDDAPDSPYFDWMHVSHLGNEPVATAIHAELERRGWLRGG